ncbi:MAG: hypothetical protein JWP89_5989 [Schlesneria sp.]|nr:hypothetical protein [Schlesneria sp.]
MEPSRPVSNTSPQQANWLNRAPAAVLAAYAIAAAFGVYFCMYAFRRPFDAVTFTDVRFLNTSIDLKTACVISQLIGYLLSKYVGALVCAEVRAHHRARLLISLILISETGLLLFAVLPPDWKPLGMLVNGLPLGMVWGVVVRYLEGRRSSEVLLAGLSCSYIIAGAITRDIGRDLVMTTWHVPAVWMPVVTGGLFFVPLWLSIRMLDRLPPPGPDDVAQRAPRHRMEAGQRRAFLKRFHVGLFLLLTAYFFLTAFRDFRDHYSAELFASLRLSHERSIFTQTEKWAVFGTIPAMGALSLIASHRGALLATYTLIVCGFATIGLATWAFSSQLVSGYVWMAWTGVGLYLAYVPFGVSLFERLMAGSRMSGTSVFAIQLADGVGYTGSAIIQLYRDLIHGQSDRLAFMIPFAQIVSIAGVVLITASGLFMLGRVSDPPGE